MHTSPQLIIDMARAKSAGNIEEAHTLFEELYRTVRTPIVQGLRRSVYLPKSERPSIHDAVHEGLFSVYQNCHTFDVAKTDTADAWLYQICRNKLIDILRQSKSWHRGIIDSLEIEKHDTPDGHMGPLEMLEDRDNMTKLREEIQRIPNTDHRTVATLRILGDRTPAQVAEALNMEQNTVNQNMKRARDLLARRMGLREDIGEEKPNTIPVTTSKASDRQFTPQEVSQHKTMTLNHLMQKYHCSKATASRIRNGQTSYQATYHERELYLDTAQADAMMTDIHQSATRALENAVEAMRKILQKEGVTQERLDTLLNAIDRDDIYQAIIARLREVAGHLRFAEERWRNQVAYHKAIRCVEAAIRRSLKVSA